MIGLILSLAIDAIDASPIDELTVIGIPAVAIAEEKLSITLQEARRLRLLAFWKA